MMPDSLGFLVGLAALTGMGFGPALWFLAPGPKRVVLALGLAPALGLVLIGLVEPLAVIYIGPVQVWAVPVTLVVLVISAAAVAAHWRRHREEFQALPSWREAWPVAALLVLSLGLLLAPVIRYGIQYTIFRSNSSDALVYMSLAESLRTVHWQTLLNGTALTPANLPNLAALAAASPTALFTARFVSATTVQNYPGVIAWGAQLTGLPVYRYYYLMALVCFAAALPAGWAVASRMHLPRSVWYLVGPAVALGFWARFVLERDAGYQISSIPTLLLLVFAWVQLEEQPPAWLSPARLLLALSLTAILYFHPAVIVVVAIAFVIYYGVGLIQRQVPMLAVWQHAATAGLVVALLLLSGQLVAAVSSVIASPAVVQQLLTIEAEVIELLRQDALSSIWGLPRPWLVWPLPGSIETLVRYLALLLGLAWSASFITSLVTGAWRPTERALRIILSVVGGGLVVLAVSWKLNNLRAADKAFTYIYPYLLLAAAGAATAIPAIKRVNLKPLITVGLAGLLLSQLAIGSLLPFYHRASGLFAAAAPSKPVHYDLSPIVSYLDQHPPRLLLVDVPRTKTWEFALYTMFVFERYPAYFQSGLVLDNNTTYQNFWPSHLAAPPDYALVLRATDTIGPAGLGTPAAETPDLILYHIDQTDLAPFQAREAAERAQDSAKPLFPSLAQNN